ncbi:MFS transporter [Nocardioides bruguierae]|uniref:MFS transporter n=1 Tax=Nocardioides bruguierae TaxID=2945102 RepID=A0A9X2D4G8_9ACTN|nr:MFS transporter [Nocardioides bruguierae]MCM0618991.1 MFS transporter [Nocardioides bruguierae]
MSADAAEQPGTRERLRDSFDTRLLAPMMLGSVLNPINSSIIAVALVPIGLALRVSSGETAWLVSSLYLATAIGQPVVGRLVDVVGPRTLFLAGGALVGVGGLLGTFAQDLGTLVAARVLIGLGTCAGYPSAMYLIRSEAARTGRDSPATVLTLLTVSSQTVIVIGPTLGGLLIDLGGWRATFAVDVPLAVLVLVLGWRRVPPTRHPDGTRPALSLDVPGVALFSALLAALLVVLMLPSTSTAWLLLVVVAAGGGLVWWERRHDDPFIDVRVLAGNRPLVLTYLRQLLTGLTSYGVLYGLTQWFEEGRGLSPSATGLLLLPLSGAALVVSALTGRRPDVHLKLVVGAVFQLAGALSMLLLASDSPLWFLVVMIVVFGVPQGLLNLGNQNALYHQAEPSRTASSAGLLRTFLYLGAIGSSAAIAAFYTQDGGSAGVHALGWFLVVVSALNVALTVLDPSLRRVGVRGD